MIGIPSRGQHDPLFVELAIGNEKDQISAGFHYTIPIAQGEVDSSVTCSSVCDE